MIKRVLFLGILIGLLHSAAYSVDFVRLKRNINREWKFVLSDIKGAEVTDFNDGDWQNISATFFFDTLFYVE